ncbi:ABC transporter permease [Limnochorda pilosa]|uniref:Peptide ABC transporter permease n=1 Tax=Limnochorda pilosa TaxID=1555112 RepID=A0A0K2SJR1_LIMPI|nr:ABC transporter permease [Limnochorda pilosa]BAS27353.1 peptide ABC transporter permease [Limnochorda pilosa]
MSASTEAAAAGVVVKEVKGKSLGSDARRRFFRNRLAVLGLVITVGLILVAVFAPYVAPYDPMEQLAWQDPALSLAAPSWAHPFGTDLYGRDLFSRVIFGTRISLAIAVMAAVVTTAIGITLGSLAGYFRGWVDSLITWLINVVWSFPFLLFVLAIITIFPEASLTIVFIAIGVVSWPDIARMTRGQFLAARENEYVEAARAVGAGDFLIIFRHILPNILAPMLVQATLAMGAYIQLEAALSFLGFGVPPPTPSWGRMASEGQNYLFSGQWWWSIMPGIAIMITVLGFNLLGDGLRDALDVRQQTES